MNPRKVKTTELKPESVDAFKALWALPPKTFRKWDKDLGWVYEPVSKGSRLLAERYFQAIVDAKVAPPSILYAAFYAYITEEPWVKKGYFQHVSTFFGPEKSTYLEWLERGREIQEAYGE